MSITPSTLLSLPVITTGTESGLWGDYVNNGLTQYLDIAIAGGLIIPITITNVTLTNTSGTNSVTNIGSTTAQYAILTITGAKTAARSLILPSSSREYTIDNSAATGGFLLTVKGAATTGVTLVDGEKAIVAWNTSTLDYVKISSSISTSSSIQPITASVAANALTVTLNPTALDFRSATLTSGTVTTRTLAAAISVVVPSTATLGTTSAVQSDIMVLAIDNAGTVELAVVNNAGTTELLETGVISTTAISAGATSANVVYSTTARTSVAYRVVGMVRSTQATAGTWATTPSLLQGLGGRALVTTPAYTGPRSQIFTASGTFTVPTNITSATVALFSGGGGGKGGGGPSGATGTSGGTGAVTVLVTGLTPGASVTVTVGAGGNGAAGSAGIASNGTTGGTTSFGSFASLTGGAGGGTGATATLTASYLRVNTTATSAASGVNGAATTIGCVTYGGGGSGGFGWSGGGGGGGGVDFGTLGGAGGAAVQTIGDQSSGTAGNNGTGAASGAGGAGGNNSGTNTGGTGGGTSGGGGGGGGGGAGVVIVFW